MQLSVYAFLCSSATAIIPPAACNLDEVTQCVSAIQPKIDSYSDEYNICNTVLQESASCFAACPQNMMSDFIQKYDNGRCANFNPYAAKHKFKRAASGSNKKNRKGSDAEATTTTTTTATATATTTASGANSNNKSEPVPTSDDWLVAESEFEMQFPEMTAEFDLFAEETLSTEEEPATQTSTTKSKKSKKSKKTQTAEDVSSTKPTSSVSETNSKTISKGDNVEFIDSLSASQISLEPTTTFTETKDDHYTATLTSIIETLEAEKPEKSAEVQNKESASTPSAFNVLSSASTKVPNPAASDNAEPNPDASVKENAQQEQQGNEQVNEQVHQQQKANEQNYLSTTEGNPVDAPPTPPTNTPITPSYPQYTTPPEPEFAETSSLEKQSVTSFPDFNPQIHAVSISVSDYAEALASKTSLVTSTDENVADILSTPLTSKADIRSQDPIYFQTPSTASSSSGSNSQSGSQSGSQPGSTAYSTASSTASSSETTSTADMNHGIKKAHKNSEMEQESSTTTSESATGTATNNAITENPRVMFIITLLLAFFIFW